jgi:hypothetical protein
VVDDTTGITPGMFVKGTGFTSDQTVVSVTNGTTLKISDSADSTPSGTLIFDYINALITRNINATIATVDRIAFDASTGTSNFYVNMPIRVDNSIGGLILGTTYFVTEYSGEIITDPLNPAETIPRPNIEVTVTSTSSSGNSITCDDTTSLYIGMKIITFVYSFFLLPTNMSSFQCNVSAVGLIGTAGGIQLQSAICFRVVQPRLTTRSDGAQPHGSRLIVGGWRKPAAWL